MGPLEKGLQDEMDALGTELNKAWEDHGDKFAKKIEKFKPKNLFEPGTGKPGVTAPDVATAAGAIPALGSQQVKKEIFGSFSAAALAAQGGSGDKTADKVDELKRQQAREHKEMLQVVRESGGLVA